MKRKIEESIKARLEGIIDVNICEKLDYVSDAFVVKSRVSTKDDINLNFVNTISSECINHIKKLVWKKLPSISLNEFDKSLSYNTTFLENIKNSMMMSMSSNNQ